MCPPPPGRELLPSKTPQHRWCRIWPCRSKGIWGSEWGDIGIKKGRVCLLQPPTWLGLTTEPGEGGKPPDGAGSRGTERARDAPDRHPAAEGLQAAAPITFSNKNTPLSRAEIGVLWGHGGHLHPPAAKLCCRGAQPRCTAMLPAPPALCWADFYCPEQQPLSPTPWEPSDPCALPGSPYKPRQGFSVSAVV